MTEKKSDTALPCAFCGHAPILVITQGGKGLFQFQCPSTDELCEMQPKTAYYGRLKHALRAWNQRPEKGYLQ